jgi:hypothetical protein
MGDRAQLFSLPRVVKNLTVLAGAAGLVLSDHACLHNAPDRKLAVGMEVLQQPFNH